jgi:uncharacterized protein YbjT (DUF2867 family)
MNTRTAIIFGSTGLVGSALVSELINSGRYNRIKIFARNKTEFSSAQIIEEQIIDFSNLSGYSGLITGDDLYICTGTTIRKAGSIAKMEEIDRDLPVRIASIALANGVKKLAVVSSIGANPASSNYYLRIKGEMEKGILDLNYDSIAIVRPSMLLGVRKEKRTGEAIGKIFIKTFSLLLSGKFLKYRGIEAVDVAKAMIYLLQGEHDNRIVESDELQNIAKTH